MSRRRSSNGSPHGSSERRSEAAPCQSREQREGGDAASQRSPRGLIETPAPRASLPRKTSQCTCALRRGGTSMRNKFVALLLLATGAMFMWSAIAIANGIDDGYDLHPKMVMAPPSGASLARINSSAAGDPDTTYIGHIATTGARPAPYHGVAGGYGPYHIGSGPARFNGTAAGKDGMWTFDDFQPGETDSLQGWWPVRFAYPFILINGQPDDQRPWFALDYGNVTNYVLNQGAGHKRTNGIVGAWHRDPGSTVPGPGSQGVGWSPSGSA